MTEFIIDFNILRCERMCVNMISAFAGMTGLSLDFPQSHESMAPNSQPTNR
jgi:hypothetical protein